MDAQTAAATSCPHCGGSLEIPHVARLSKDLIAATEIMSDAEARFVVDAYYIIQEDRKRSGNQIRSMKSEPHALLAWFFEQNKILEAQLKKALERYSNTKEIGRWMKSIYGVGPVIAAGLMAHIDIHKAVTAGNIYSFAGYDPTMVWEKGQKRPFNGDLRTLCWNIGMTFMRFSNREQCLYGRLYAERKEFEVRRNDNGYNRERAATLLPRFNPAKEAYQFLKVGKLPPGHIDAMARRWAVKIFLSHVQEVWYEMEFKKRAPASYAIGILKHSSAHYIPPPNWTSTVSAE